MDTRLMLQITLGVLGVLILVIGGLIVGELTRDADTQVVERVVDKDDKPHEEPNPWASAANRQAAIKLVKRHRVRGLDHDDQRSEMSISEVVVDDEFVSDKLKITEAKPVGWEATWWGDTKYGPSYYLVRYVFADASIHVGPAWLVDLKQQKIVPKNVLATVAENPAKGVKSDYYDKATQVVSAMTSHRFDSGVNLSGALLLYFKKRVESSDQDTILGWTIDHDRGNKFDAYFQWVEQGEPTYAEFKFDYDRKALKAVNLQAADIMRAGEKFEQTSPVDIKPQSYSAGRHEFVKGPCRKRPNHPGCRSLDTVLSNDTLMESLEWMLTGRAESTVKFEVCKQKHNCRFQTQKKSEGEYRILYIYNLDKPDAFDRRHVDPEWACKYSLEAKDAEHDSKGWATKGHCMAWDIDVKSGDITPIDHTSTLAYRAVHSRG